MRQRKREGEIERGRETETEKIRRIEKDAFIKTDKYRGRESKKVDYLTH